MKSLRERSDHLSHNPGHGNMIIKIECLLHYVLQLGIELIERLILLHLYLLKTSREPLKLWILENLSPSIGCLDDGPCFLCSFSWRYFLNSLLVTTQNRAFNAPLLKFAALILASSQSAGASFGFTQPISTVCQTFSSKDYKKTLMRTFQYA